MKPIFSDLMGFKTDLIRFSDLIRFFPIVVVSGWICRRTRVKLTFSDFFRLKPIFSDWGSIKTDFFRFFRFKPIFSDLIGFNTDLIRFIPIECIFSDWNRFFPFRFGVHWMTLDFLHFSLNLSEMLAQIPRNCWISWISWLSLATLCGSGGNSFPFPYVILVVYDSDLWESAYHGCGHEPRDCRIVLLV